MIWYVVAHRLRTGARSVLAAGLVLGLLLGVALASFAVARDTSSAYGRVLAASDAETFTVAHSRSPEEAAAVLDALPAIDRHRYQGGFVGYVAGEDRALVGTDEARLGNGAIITAETLAELIASRTNGPE